MHNYDCGRHSFLPRFQRKVILSSQLCLSSSMVRMARRRKSSKRKLYEDSSEENESKDMCVIEKDHHKNAGFVCER